MNLETGDFIVLRKFETVRGCGTKKKVDLYEGRIYKVLLQTPPMIALRCEWAENNENEGSTCSLHEDDFTDWYIVPPQYVQKLKRETNKFYKTWKKRYDTSKPNTSYAACGSSVSG
jgi:hypothetical protein